MIFVFGRVVLSLLEWKRIVDIQIYREGKGRGRKGEKYIPFAGDQTQQILQREIH